jgi:predicted ATPase
MTPSGRRSTRRSGARTLDAVKRLLFRESQMQPLLVVFEDLHWIDTETQALLNSLVESLPTARALLLVNYRPEYQHDWGRKTYYTQLRLDSLPPESAEELLHALLGADPAFQPLRGLLIDRTQGNPFFLEESVRTLVETDVLIGERGAYRLSKPFQATLVPATVQAVLAARIDRLPPEEKRLLQTASVIGKDVPLPLLQDVAELTDDELGRGLAHLQAAEFLYETSLFPDLEYTFKHALTHDVAYGSLLLDRRRALHARIVHAIEVSYPDRLAEHAERLAHHAFRGEAWEKALVYLRQAGAKAIVRCAYRQAVEYLDQALVALQHLPRSPETIAQAIDLRCDLRNAHMLSRSQTSAALPRQARLTALMSR